MDTVEEEVEMFVNDCAVLKVIVVLVPMTVIMWNGTTVKMRKDISMDVKTMKGMLMGIGMAAENCEGT